MKGPTGKSIGGIYSNPRFIHTAASLVGSIVYIQVRNGSMYEGVFRTFSEKVDLVLEMAYKVEKKSSSISTMLSNKFEPSQVTQKMIFPIEDVIVISAVNVDLEYATRETFTDTAISRFNGQVQERVLEPWDGGISSDTLTDLGTDEVSNGWAADEMFRTNEVKYGVKSSFDSDLHDYTIPLKKQNTEEYKQQEAKASKIAQEIESSFHHKTRISLENGDEEERFSAVVRTESMASPAATNNSNNNISTISNNNNNRFVPQRARKAQGVRPIRSSPSPNAHANSRVPPVQSYHKPSQNLQSMAQSKVPNVKPAVMPQIPKPSVTSTTSTAMHSLPPRQGASPQSPMAPNANVSSSTAMINSIPHGQVSENSSINGDVPRAALKEPCNKEMNSAESPPMPPREKKSATPPKIHDEKTEDLKRFHAKFKLLEGKETKNAKEEALVKTPSSECSESGSESMQSLGKKSSNDKMSDPGEETDSVSESMKNSSLNPNAKEFVLNPNAKSFTPRGGISMPVGILPPPMPPPAVQPSPRLHTQSPVIAVPQTHLMPSMPHHVFNVAPHYVLPATPVSVPIAPPYTPATSMAQAPRYRKAMPMTLPRNDSSQSIHVQAATGQPILAPPTLSAPQFAIQYASSPGILHSTAPPQPQLTYTTQMFSMQRVLTPQPLGMVSAASYGENAHVPTQLYMNPQAVAGVAHPGQSANSGPHSTPSTPQSQTPNLHTAPSPVHQPPPPPHGQAPTPTGHPSNPPTPHLVYHSQLAAQHPLHINPASSNHSHPYPTVYGAGPQPIMLVPQQAMPGPHPHHPAAFSTLQNHFHGQTTGAHAAAPAQLIPHPQVAMMPTSTAMAVSNNHHYVPHSQGVFQVHMQGMRELGTWRKSSIS